MRKIGKRVHPTPEIEWRTDKLPELPETKASGEKFDLIILSAVWMHVKPEDRQLALSNLAGLLKPDGAIYLTLRVGPAEPARGIYTVSVSEVEQLAAALNLNAEKLDEQADLLGRSNIRWAALSVSAQ